MDNEELTIKLATIGDLNAVQELNLALFKKEFEEFDETLNCEWTFSPEGEEYFKKKITGNDSCVFVATEGEKIIGYLAGGLSEESTYKTFRTLESLAELENILILDGYRGRGAGEELMKAFIEWCKSKGIKRAKVVVSAKNIHAINFYKKGGFFEYESVLEIDI